eukprot:1193343-Prorocentrum_minimum.AAC.7
MSSHRFVSVPRLTLRLCSQTLPFTLRIPYESLSYATAVFSLLLVFRTNSSYDRWWEARKVRGSRTSSPTPVLCTLCTRTNVSWQASASKSTLAIWPCLVVNPEAGRIVPMVQIWEELLSRSRDFVRQGLAWMDPKDVELKEQL